ATGADDDASGPAQYSLGADFQTAYAEGTTSFRHETPAFFYGMCLVHSHSLFEAYISDTLRAIFRARPAILLHGTPKGAREEKKVKLRELLDHVTSPQTLLDKLIDSDLLNLMHRPCNEYLGKIRRRFGFAMLSDKYDRQLVLLSLIRNCVVHNRGKATLSLQSASRGFYQRDRPITITRNSVSRSITIFIAFASEFDSVASSVYG